MSDPASENRKGAIVAPFEKGKGAMLHLSIAGITADELAEALEALRWYDQRRAAG